jgi:hypothetical protein
MSRDVGYENIGFTGYVSFKSALVKGTDEDKLVKISADGTVVVVTAENDEFIGRVKIIDDKDKLASVQIDGFITMGYDANHAPSLGWDCLQAGGGDGADPWAVATSVKKISAAAGTPLRLVVDVNESDYLVTFKLDQ